MSEPRKWSQVQPDGHRRMLLSPGRSLINILKTGMQTENGPFAFGTQTPPVLLRIFG